MDSPGSARCCHLVRLTPCSGYKVKRRLSKRLRELAWPGQCGFLAPATACPFAASEASRSWIKSRREHTLSDRLAEARVFCTSVGKDLVGGPIEIAAIPPARRMYRACNRSCCSTDLRNPWLTSRNVA